MMELSIYRLAGGLWLGGWLLWLAYVDMRIGMLPNRLVLVVAVSAVYPWMMGFVHWEGALLGCAGGTGLLWLLRRLSCGGIGWGDIKLAGAAGLWLGWQALIPAFWLAFLSGGIVAVCFMMRGHSVNDKLPFGPFLAGGFFYGYLLGQTCWQWYCSWF